MSRLTLPQLYEQHAGRLSDKWSIYLSEYDRIFSPYRDLPVHLLEIGMQNGGSMEIWAKYFENAQKFVGCDIDPNCARLQSEDPRFSVVIGDATQASTQADILKASEHFDIIIDDGSHRSGEIVRAFSRYFPFLRDGGVYVAEDLHCSYWKEFEGGLFAPFSAMSFFKRLADIANFEHWGIEAAPVDILSGFLAYYGFQMDAESLQHIHSVAFVNSMCTILKAEPAQNCLGKRVIVGSLARVEADIARLNGMTMARMRPRFSEADGTSSALSVLAPTGSAEGTDFQQDIIGAIKPEVIEKTASESLRPLHNLEREALLARLTLVQEQLDDAKKELSIILPSKAWRLVGLLWQLKAVVVKTKDTAYVRGKVLLKLTQWWKALKAVPTQDRLIRRMYSPEARKLILFLVPGYDVVNGGIMSIISLVQVSRELKSEHGAEVITTTMPRHFLLTKYSKFPNSVDIFRFDQIFSYFKQLDELTIHIPEYHVPEILGLMTAKQGHFLRTIPVLHFNILIQNIWLSPTREQVDALRHLTNNITATTAHSQYCTPELQERYGIPLHHLSVDFHTQYYFKPYEEKEDLIVVSHDKNASRAAILERITSEHPTIHLCPIENTPYEDYKRLISRAKWVITFGEGLDGYFIEGIRSGAIPFAVYNPNFFSDHFLNLPNIYDSYEAMLRDLPSAIHRLDNASAFRRLSDTLIERDKLEYNADTYRENVRKFYRRQYKLP